MPAEAGVSVTVKSARGDLHTLRGDHWNDFVLNLELMLGREEGALLAESVANTFRSAITTTKVVARPAALQADGPDEAQAVANIQAAIPGTSTVGQVLPQPSAVPQPVTEALDKNGYPLNPQKGQVFDHPVNGRKVFLTGFSQKTQKDYAFWGDPR